MMNATQERMDANTKEMKAKMDSNQAEICTFRSELKDTMQRETRATIQSVRSDLGETTACREAMETEPGP
jgi:hypothetical protein